MTIGQRSLVGLLLVWGLASSGARAAPGAMGGAPPAGTPASQQPGERIWVLPKTAAAALLTSFGKAEPALRLTGARLEPERVRARVCVGTACYKLQLTHPKRDCQGYVAGPWCVKETPPLPKPHRRLLGEVLGAHRASTYWLPSRRRGMSQRPMQAHSTSRRQPARPATEPSRLRWILIGLLATFLLGWGLLEVRRRFR